MLPLKADLTQDGEELHGVSSRVLPVDVQTVEVVLTQELDHALDEGLTGGSATHHVHEPEGETEREFHKGFLPFLRLLSLE